MQLSCGCSCCYGWRKCFIRNSPVVVILRQGCFFYLLPSRCHVQKNRREVTVVVYASAGEVTPPLSSGTSCATAAPQPDAVCRPSCQSHRTGSILNPRTPSSALRLPPRRQRRPVCRRTSIRSFPRPHKAREFYQLPFRQPPLLTDEGGRTAAAFPAQDDMCVVFI